MKFEKTLLALVIGACAALVGTPAMAQWQWIDKSGSKVFSDRPPPSDIPEKSILKQPGGVTRQAAPAESAPSDGTAKAADATAKAPAGVDKELEEKKAQAEKAEAAKQKAEEAKVSKARTDNCQRARQGKAALDSGMRMAQMNAKGERIILDDAARAAESKRMDAVIASDCK